MTCLFINSTKRPGALLVNCYLQAVSNSSARSEARTGEIEMEQMVEIETGRNLSFSQASVVAPPDGPDLGNCINLSMLSMRS